MGASGWEHLVPYQQDLGAALDALRRQVFASGDFIKPSYYGAVFDLPEPSSVDDLFEQEQYWEFMGTSGTHSIIDVVNVVPVGFTGEEFGTIRPLSDAECVELFGVAQPGRADFTPLSNSGRLHEYVTGGRWTGRAAVLWADSAPAEIAFWGFSGDLKPEVSVSHAMNAERVRCLPRVRPPRTLSGPWRWSSPVRWTTLGGRGREGSGAGRGEAVCAVAFPCRRRPGAARRTAHAGRRSCGS